MSRSWVSRHLDSDHDGAVHQQTRVSGHPRPEVEQLATKPAGTRIATPPDMPTHLHLVREDGSRPVAPRSTAEDPALRPTSFDDYIGQADVIENLRGSVRAARRGGWQLDHMLMAGPAGLGKTSLAAVVAAELGAKLRATSAPAIEHKGALASLLTTLEEGDVLFIDEIHALDRAVAECLYSAMEDHVIDLPAGKRVIRVPLPKFTLLGATTHAGKLPKPLLDRFGFIWQLRPYTLPEMTTIIARSATKLGVTIDEDGAMVIARASRGTPRLANRLLRRVRDAATNAAAAGALVVHGEHVGKNGAINGPLAVAALARLGIDHLGLDPLDRRYLAVVAERPIGIEAICAELAEDRSTIEDAVEPFLLQAGLIKRGSKGRLTTAEGREHLTKGAS
jgi:holliday junction DNA helicase RuvB